MTDETKEDKITIDKKIFDSLNKKLDKQERDIAMLLETTDKRRLGTWLEKNKESNPPQVRLAMISTEKGKKLVVGWNRMKSNDVYETNPGKWVEEQSVELLYDDGTSEEMSYKNWVRRYETIEAIRLGVITDDRTGKTAYKLQRGDNKKEIVVGVEFVNP